MTTFASLPPQTAYPRNAVHDWLRWIGLLLASAGFVLPFVAWLAGPSRWWSVFIFAPAYVQIGLAMIQWRLGGRFSHWGIRINLGLGAIVMTLALIFMLGARWRYAWTLMLIAPGLVLAISAYSRAPRGSAGFGFASWIASLGLSVAALGVVFLGQQLDGYDLQQIFGDFAWWSLLIAAPGFVALRCGWLTRFGRGARVCSMLLIVIGCLHLAAGLAELFDVALFWLPPIMAVAIGSGALLSASRQAEE